MMRAGALALVGSVVLHLTVAAVVLPALAARPPMQQMTPQSRLVLGSVQVRRSHAEAKTPAANAAGRMQTAGARIGGGGVARIRAPAQAVTGTRRAARVAEGATLAALVPDSTAMIPVVTVAAPLAAAAPTPTVTQSLMPDTVAADVLATKPESLTPVVTVAPPLPAVAPATARPNALNPDAMRTTATVPPASKAKILTPAAPVIRAGLAWSGSQNVALDARSVATLTAFLQPGGIDGQQVRDRMAGIMAAPPCSRIHTVFDPATGGLDLRGHVPDAASRAPLLAALRAQIGGGLALRDMLRILPEPQCGLLDGIAALGLPQSEEQLTDSDLVGENAQVREYAFLEGDRLTIDLIAPDYPAYVYVDYFDAAGLVIHLRPNTQSPLERMAPDAVFSIGRGDDVDLRIAPPFGQDIAVAFAASVPLYDGLRPLVEPAAPYLETLRGLIAQQRMAHPDFRGEWVYLFVATRQGEPVE